MHFLQAFYGLKSQSRLQQTTFIFINFLVVIHKYGLSFHVNRLPAEVSHEVTCIIWFQESAVKHMNVVCSLYAVKFWRFFNSLPPGKFFSLFCHLLIFSKMNLFEKLFHERFVGPDLGPICLQRLSADEE